MRAIVLDNEAVQALLSTDHRKHRTVLAHLVGATRRRRTGGTMAAVVPTAVRVEAGWDRRDPATATVNRFRIGDRHLDTVAADVAAAIAARTGVTVADAHLGAVVRQLDADEIVVLTSDPDDARRVAAPVPITAVRI